MGYATLPVGSFAPNCLGLYDRAGSVFQWCNDLYDEHYYSKSANVSPKGGDERSGYPGGEGYHVASSEAASLKRSRLRSRLGASLAGPHMGLPYICRSDGK